MYISRTKLQNMAKDNCQRTKTSLGRRDRIKVHADTTNKQGQQRNRLGPEKTKKVVTRSHWRQTRRVAQRRHRKHHPSEKTQDGRLLAKPNQTKQNNIAQQDTTHHSQFNPALVLLNVSSTTRASYHLLPRLDDVHPQNRHQRRDHGPVKHNDQHRVHDRQRRAHKRDAESGQTADFLSDAVRVTIRTWPRERRHRYVRSTK